MNIILAIAIGVGLLVIGVLFLIFSFSWIRQDDVSQRLHTYVGDREQNRQLETSLRVRRLELRGSFAERTLFPFFRSVAGLVGNLLPARRVAVLDHKLLVAGNPMGMRAREFIGLQMAFVLLGGLLSVGIALQEIQYKYLLMAILLLIILMLPGVWLNRKIRERQSLIRRQLPDVIDMLSVCTSAGLSFDQSLQRVSDEWHTQLSWEFGRVVSEMEMGLTRRDALKNLAERLDVSELSSFVSIIIQSDRLGMSISNTLHALAKQMRIEWRFKAQEEARKLPVKILIPLVFFIFPAMLVVILGPSVPAIMDMFTLL
ncbi:MAG TPA: type II secretion system protein [Chloroflexi bacterium]|nr:type II secretion system protein [Chloroflexota bacterium]